MYIQKSLTNEQVQGTQIVQYDSRSKRFEGAEAEASDGIAAAVKSTTIVNCVPQDQLNCSHYCYYGSTPDEHNCSTCDCTGTDVGEIHHSS